MRSPLSRATATHKRWNQNGPAAKFVREGVASCEIDLSHQPKVTCDTHPMQFDGHALDQVRGHIKKLRTSDGKILVDQGALQ